ncbi:MAG: LysR family transcriptional regulator [Eubacteriales bacterium]|nr:LysR family transcriptional regulator [Eubacteriales bacterium]MDD3214562.1 LysR family transcriptional regulator [Eubacteriales bacterium]
MNTLYFHYVLVVERERSISRAAERLFISQPSLSKAIREMEDSLGYAVFERSPKGVIPTPEGKKLLVSARRIVAELEKVEAIRTPEQTETLSLRFSLPRCSYLADGFAAFMTRLDLSKGIDIRMQETNSLQAINNVANGQCQLAVIRYQPLYEAYFLDALKERRLEGELIWESDYLALFSQQHSLAQAPVVTLEQLREGIEIVYGDSYVPYLSANETIQNRDPLLADRHVYLFDRANQFELLSRLPTAYLWASPLPAGLLKRYALAQRKCEAPNHRFKDMLVYPTGYRFTELDRRLVDRLYAAKNEVAFMDVH